MSGSRVLKTTSKPEAGTSTWTATSQLKGAGRGGGPASSSVSASQSSSGYALAAVSASGGLAATQLLPAGSSSSRTAPELSSLRDTKVRKAAVGPPCGVRLGVWVRVGYAAERAPEILLVDASQCHKLLAL